MDVDLDDAGVRRNLDDAQARVEGRRIALDMNGDAGLGRGRLDGGDELKIVLQRVDGRHEDAEQAVARHEPHLGRARPTFLTHWPAPQAALARRDPADGRAALRFELYAAGLELANAFDELTDPAEQRTRFVADVAARRAIHGAEGWDVDEDFLAALGHGMPEGSGIALGFDRLAMLAAGARSVSDVLWLPFVP